MDSRVAQRVVKATIGTNLPVTTVANDGFFLTPVPAPDRVGLAQRPAAPGGM